MCGIAGIISPHGANVSATLLDMLNLIQHRGMDASGIAIYGDGQDTLLRVVLSKPGAHEKLMNLISEYGVVLSEKMSDQNAAVVFAELKLQMDNTCIPALHAAINAVDGLYVHSLGQGMAVYKENGPISNLTGKHSISQPMGTHGIGHVRMATESAEDVNAAHPFVSPLFPELSIVHNGQFTNYYNIRRSLESKGAPFKTRNDSEAASHFIAYQMKINGGDLEQALKAALEELDGIYCIIASTPHQIGYVRDRLGIKPLLVFQDGDTTLFGSEQIEFTSLYPEVYAEEVEPGEVKVWNI